MKRRKTPRQELISKYVKNIRRDEYDVLIDRSSKWGNPFIIGKDGTREEVIEKYRRYIMSNESLRNSVKELENKRLGCHCSPKACHGDVLIDLIYFFTKEN
jgi:hypothetical protein